MEEDIRKLLIELQSYRKCGLLTVSHGREGGCESSLQFRVMEIFRKLEQAERVVKGLTV